MSEKEHQDLPRDLSSEITFVGSVGIYSGREGMLKKEK